MAAALFNTNAGTIKGWFHHAVEVVEAFGNAIEQGNRYAEYRRVKRRGASEAEAVYAADEITTNFHRHGKATKEVDKVFAYTNAGVQGLYREARQIKEHPVQFAVKMLTSSVVMATLVTAINKLIDGGDEYEKLSNYTKNNYYCFHVGDGRFVKIAKARTLSVIESAMERAWESLAEEDPDAWNAFADYFLTTFSTAGSNPILSTYSDIRANESFSGAAIVPQSMQSLPEGEQYDGKTSYVARGIASGYNYTIGWLADKLGIDTQWSPMNVEYAINQMTGVLGDIVTGFAPESDWGNVLGGGYLTADSAYSTDALNVLYEQREELEKRKNSVKNPDTAALYSYKAYDAVLGTLSAINKYGKMHESQERACRMLARDEALAFREGFEEDADLIRLYEATGDGEIFPFRAFSTEFSYDGEKHALSPTETVQMMHDYTDAVEAAYEEILGMELNDEQAVAALKKAKDNVYKAVREKYVELSGHNGGDPDAPIMTNTAGLSDGEYASFRSELAALKEANDPKVSDREDAEIAKEFLEASDLDDVQRAAVWADAGHMTDASYEKYADCGLDRSQSEQFAYRYGDITSDKDEDGKTISGSKKAKVCEAIDDFCDEQGLSSEVKYRLYAACGYKENSVNDAPWYRPSDESRDWFDDLW